MALTEIEYYQTRLRYMRVLLLLLLSTAYKLMLLVHFRKAPHLEAHRMYNVGLQFGAGGGALPPTSTKKTMQTVLKGMCPYRLSFVPYLNGTLAYCLRSSV